MFTQARWHLSPVLGPPDSYLSSIQLADAGTAVAAALHAPAGMFNVVDDEPLTSLTRSLRVKNTRFRTTTGWAPRYPSAREGWLVISNELHRTR